MPDCERQVAGHGPGAPALGGAVPGDPAARLFDDPGAEVTLDALVSGAWERLAAHGRVACPACGGAMAPRYGSHSLPVEGRCEDCGTVLS